MSKDLEVNKPLNQEVPLKTTNNVNANRTKQYFAAIAVSLGGFSAGTVFSWTSPALEYLLEGGSKSNNTAPGFTISTSEEAIVSAILNLSALIFGTIAGKCADFFGRKLVLLLASLFCVISFAIIVFAHNVAMLVAARVFAGISVWVAFTVCPMYIGEIADDTSRGTLGSLLNVFIVLGLIYTNIVGPFTNWISLNVALMIFPLMCCIAVFFIPESPVYLVAAKKLEKAKKSLQFYRNNKILAYEELTYLQKQALDHSNGAGIINFFTNPCYRKVLIAGVGIFSFQQFGGINVVVFYTVPIFNAAGGSINPALGAIITNFVSLLMGIVSAFIINKRSRKYFLILSAFTMMIGLTGLGLFFQLQHFNINFLGLQFLPVASLMLFMAGFAIGFGPVPFILVTEYYGQEIRGVAVGFLVAISWIFAFISTLSYPILTHWFGNYVTFYLYGLINLLGICFVHFMVLETKT